MMHHRSAGEYPSYTLHVAKCVTLSNWRYSKKKTPITSKNTLEMIGNAEGTLTASKPY